MSPSVLPPIKNPTNPSRSFPERSCEWCGRAFRPWAVTGRFCTVACFGASRSSAALGRLPKDPEMEAAMRVAVEELTTATAKKETNDEQ